MRKLLQSLILGLGLFLFTTTSFSQVTNNNTNVVYYNDVTVTTITTTIVSGPTTNLPALLALKSSSVAPVSPNGVVSATSPTNTTTVVVSNILKSFNASTNSQRLTSDILNTVIDDSAFITNSKINLDEAVLYNSSLTNKLSYFAGLSLATSQQSSVGLGGAFINHQWYDANISLKLGTKISLPWIGQTYAWTANGANYNFSKSSVGSYDFFGDVKTFDIFKNLNLSLGPTFGIISNQKGIFMGLTLELNYHF